MPNAVRPPLFFAAVAFTACVSNHHVSPFPDLAAMGGIVPPSDLAAQVKRLDDEAAESGYTLATELRGKLGDGGEIVVRGYDVRDPLGRTCHATRVATPSGIVLALGPPDPKELTPRADQLVPALVEGGWRSGTDLNGDGTPDVVVADGRGVFAIWRIEALGATPLPIELAWPPTHAVDANGDGRPDFAATLTTDDALAPRLDDVATYEDGRYTDASAGAKAWHAAERDAATERVAKARDAKDVTSGARAAVEQAWHAGMTGEDGGVVLATLDAFAAKHAPLPDGVAQAWVRWRGFVADRFAPRQRGGAPSALGAPDGG